MAGDAEVLINNARNILVSQNEETSISSQTEIDSVFSSKTLKKYPPDGSNFKYYIYGRNREFIWKQIHEKFLS